jgi:hypothetical protein
MLFFQDDKYIYEGTWKTTNRKLDGVQTCEVKWLGGENWEGTFWGTWHRQDYKYKVKFTGPSTALTGEAEIDGANYTWKGTLYQEKFTGSFTGDRYTGSFDMPRKK